MPVYEYQCKACGRDFEYQQRMSDPDKTDCEACGGALDRLISRTAFALKGSGWYKDLYASPKPEKGDKGEKGDKADGAGEVKADGKAADKPGAKADAPAASADKPASKPSSDSGGSSSGGSSAGGSSSGGSGGGGSGSGGSGSGGGSSGSVAKVS
jgi:putative FmdB family regulatory protein